MNLRDKIIRLANAKPELRRHLLPLLKQGAQFRGSPMGTLEVLEDHKTDYDEMAVLQWVSNRPSLRGESWDKLMRNSASRKAAERLSRKNFIDWDGLSEPLLTQKGKVFFVTVKSLVNKANLDALDADAEDAVLGDAVPRRNWY